ncbi:hypothetical protein RCG17_00540 [Neobacillus sp. PS3-12]|uniref:hypothetical protein n=1 Tax=Neobacillus sp. PS3-12 TaxID=3070677 RepID=UPI0027DF83E2|nr:hypothetical protein [Neobacillus sp. PS3-12]WML53238.1 hypothetical protein RCG17_00540 [Neobacillus sp. PS3-12]
MGVGRIFVEALFYLVAACLCIVSIYDVLWAYQIHNAAPVLVAIFLWIVYFAILGAVRFFRRKKATNS